MTPLGYPVHLSKVGNLNESDHVLELPFKGHGEVDPKAFFVETYGDGEGFLDFLKKHAPGACLK